MNQGNLPLRRFVQGGSRNQITTANLNAPIDALDHLRRDVQANARPILVGDGVVVQTRVAVLTNRGPNNEAQRTGTNKYWAKIQRADVADANLNVPFVDETKPGMGGIVLAENLSETATSRGLASDETVYVRLYRVVYPVKPPVAKWFFVNQVIGVGQYQGQVLQVVSQNQAGWDFVPAVASLT